MGDTAPAIVPFCLAEVPKWILEAGRASSFEASASHTK